MKISRINLLTCKVLFIVFALSFNVPLAAQTNSDGTTPQFLLPEFITSTVLMKNGLKQDILLNYNIVFEKMVYLKDEQFYDIMNTEMIDTVYLNNRKFVPGEKCFQEVILAAPITFFIQHTGELLPPGTPAGYGGTSQVSNTKMMTYVQLSQGYYNIELPINFSVKTVPIYWARHEKNMSSFVNVKQFMKIFPDEEAELKQFIKENHIKFERQSDIIMLAEYVNRIIK